MTKTKIYLYLGIIFVSIIICFGFVYYKINNSLISKYQNDMNMLFNQDIKIKLNKMEEEFILFRQVSNVANVMKVAKIAKIRLGNFNLFNKNLISINNKNKVSSPIKSILLNISSSKIAQKAIVYDDSRLFLVYANYFIKNKSPYYLVIKRELTKFNFLSSGYSIYVNIDNNNFSYIVKYKKEKNDLKLLLKNNLNHMKSNNLIFTDYKSIYSYRANFVDNYGFRNIQIIENINDKKFDLIHLFEYLIYVLLFFVLAMIMIIWFLFAHIFNHYISRVGDFYSDIRHFLDFSNMHEPTYIQTTKKYNGIFKKIIKEVNESGSFLVNIRSENKNGVSKLTNVIDEFSKGNFRVDFGHIMENDNSIIPPLLKSFEKSMKRFEFHISNLKYCLYNYEKKDFRVKIDITDDMMGDLRELNQSVNNLGYSLMVNSKQDIHNANVITNSSNNMDNLVNGLVDSSNKQSEYLFNAVNSIKKISDWTKEDGENASFMSKLSISLKQATKNGNKDAYEVKTSIANINKQMVDINKAVNNIEDITFRTKILSLNASVESAHAGEAGKGFAVVAGDIKELATKSSENSYLISDLVSGSGKEIKKMIELVHKMISNFNILSENVDDTIELIDSVVSSVYNQLEQVDKTNDFTSKLSTANEKSLVDIKEIKKEMSDILRLSKKLSIDNSEKKV